MLISIVKENILIYIQIGECHDCTLLDHLNNFINSKRREMEETERAYFPGLGNPYNLGIVARRPLIHWEDQKTNPKISSNQIRNLNPIYSLTWSIQYTISIG